MFRLLSSHLQALQELDTRYEGYPESNLRFGVAKRWAVLAPPFWCQSVPSLSKHPAVVVSGLCCFCFFHSEFLKCVLQ